MSWEARLIPVLPRHSDPLLEVRKHSLSWEWARRLKSCMYPFLCSQSLPMPSSGTFPIATI